MVLQTNNANPEFNAGGGVISNLLSPGGFALGASQWSNSSGISYVGWNWKTGKIPGLEMQSVVATSNTATFNHSLEATPAFVLARDRASSNWIVYHKDLGTGYYLKLNTTDLKIAAGAPAITASSSQFSMNSQTNGASIWAAIFAEVPGFSKFGSYTGNGSATGDGPFVYTGFKPRYIMIKRTDANGYGWEIHDTIRSQINPLGEWLFANDPSIEAGIGSARLDILSNGFKIRSNDANWNAASPATYIYAAFAEAPFKYATAR